MTANGRWITALSHILETGSASSPRSQETYEILNYHSSIMMDFPVVTNRFRKLSYLFMAAEAHWILTGDDRVESIAPFAPSIAKFSDNGETFFGAYGPRVVSQLQGVVDALTRDRDTRQACLSIWRKNPRATKDVPCTAFVQWIIRNDTLYCIDTMRSSDVWLGWPYDVFNFSMISAYIALCLRDRGIKVKLGTLHLNAGSQHLYIRNERKARECFVATEDVATEELRPFSLDWFDSPATLLEYLKQTKLGIVGKFGWLDSLLCPKPS